MCTTKNMRTISRLILFGLIVISLSSCSFVIGTDEPSSIYQAHTEPKVEISPTNTNDSGSGTFECIKDLRQPELNQNNKKRTLSSSELDQYLSIMGIAEFDFLASSIQFSNRDFSIYLLDEDISAIEFSRVHIEEVALEKTPIISSKDIVSYELNSHSILLTPAGHKRLQRAFPKPVQVSGIPFVVCIGAQRICSGAFWTPASSISYDGFIILQSFETIGTTIHLTLAYPSSDVFTGRDPRSDPRIVSALEQADKLNSITE